MLKFDIQNCTSEPPALQGPKKQGVKEGLMIQLYPSLSTSNQTPLPVRFFVPMPSLFVCFCVSFALAQVRSVLKCSLDTSCLRILETFIATSCPSADLKQFSKFSSYLD